MDPPAEQFMSPALVVGVVLVLLGLSIALYFVFASSSSTGDPGDLPPPPGSPPATLLPPPVTGGGGSGGTRTQFTTTMLDDTKAVLVQVKDKSRLTRDKSNASMFTIALGPNDGDSANNDKSRRRNEVRFKTEAFTCSKGETIQILFDFMLNAWGDVPIKDFFHFVQIKFIDGNQPERPLLTLGIKDTNLVVYKYEKGNHVAIADVRTALGRWIPIQINLVYKPNTIDISYAVLNNKGSYSVPMSKSVDLFLKLGQYRAGSEKVTNVTSTSYSNLMSIKGRV